MHLSANAQPALPLPSPEDLSQALHQALPDFGSVQWVTQTGSTNADLIQRLKVQQLNAPEHAPNRPWLLGAHLQTAGKGRAGRPWANAAGATLMFSCAFETRIPLAQLPGISPALGVATCLALRSILAAQPGNALEPLTLKWPNDLQWHGAKLAGLLIETAPSTRVVVGMGLNLSGAAALSVELDRAIADLGMIQTQLRHAATARQLTCTALVAHIAQAWHRALKDYTKHGYTAFRQDFDAVDALAGQSVQVVDHGSTLYQGIAQGTDHLGRLRVMTETGLIPVLVGDVSIRPGQSNTNQHKL